MLRQLTLGRDADFSKFNDRGEELKLMKTQYKQMELRLQCLHESEARLEENARSVLPPTLFREYLT